MVSICNSIWRSAWAKRAGQLPWAANWICDYNTLGFKLYSVQCKERNFLNTGYSFNTYCKATLTSFQTR